MTKEEVFHLGVKGLITRPDGNILLLHKEISQSWDLPGGRVQQGEHPDITLKREIYEETGLKNFSSIKFMMMELTQFRIPLPSGEVGLIFSIYQCELYGNEPVILSEEHCGFEWAHPTHAAALLKPNHPHRLIELLLQSTPLQLPRSYG